MNSQKIRTKSIQMHAAKAFNQNLYKTVVKERALHHFQNSFLKEKEKVAHSLNWEWKESRLARWERWIHPLFRQSVDFLFYGQ
jgi:hypothetical protein